MASPSQSVIWTNMLVFSDNNKFNCAVCTDDTTSSPWQEHIANAKHLLALKQLDSIFERRRKRVRCKLCGKYYHWSSIKSHGQFHEIVPWHEPDDKYQRFFENAIVRTKTNFYCCLCDDVFVDWSTALCHIVDPTHKELRQRATRLAEFSDSIPEGATHESLVTEGFVPLDGATLECNFCRSKKIEFSKIIEHVRSFSHWYNRAKFASKAHKKTINETNACEPSGDAERCCYLEQLDDKHFICKVCDCFVPTAEANGEFHLATQTHADSLEKYGCEDITSEEDNIYHCTWCNLSISDLKCLHRHIKEKIHADSMLSTKTNKMAANVDDAIKMAANVDGATKMAANMDDANKMAVNMDDANKMADAASCSLASKAVSQDPSCIYIIKLNFGEAYCRLCQIKLNDAASIKDHVDGSSHEAVAAKYGCDRISLKVGTLYHCGCCNCRISGNENVYLHVKGRRHWLSMIANQKQQQQQQQQQTTMKNTEEPGKSEQSECKKTLSSITNDDMKLYEESRSQIIGKRRRPGGPRSNPFAKVDDEKICCNLCDIVATNSVELHAHMASHVAMEFVSPCVHKNPKQTKHPSNFQRQRKNIVELNNNQKTTNKASLNLPSTEITKIHHNIPNNNVSLNQNNIDGKTNNSDDNSTVSNPRSTCTNVAGHSDNESTSTIDSGYPKKPRLLKKTTMRKIIKQLDFDKDYIYDMKEKLREIELGMKLCMIVDSKTIYCLICRKTVENNSQNYFEHLCSLDHNNYLEIMEKDHAMFEITSGQFSELDLANQYIEETSDELLRCLICDADVANDDYALYDHTESYDHEFTRDQMHVNAHRRFDDVKTQIQCNWYNVQKYWCVPCSEHFSNEMEFCRHLESREHAIVAIKWKNVGKIMIYDFCAPCALLWYGYRCTYAYHCDLLSHKWLMRDGHYAIPVLPEIAKNLLAEIGNSVDGAINFHERADENERERELAVMRDLEISVKSKFSEAKAYVCGSRAMGLASSDSNIDVFLDCGNMYDGNIESKSSVPKLLTDVHKCLNENSKSWDMNEIVTEFRYPVIRADHRTTGLACDITVTNGLPVENTKLIKSFIDVFPPCRNMMMFLKQWLKFCGLSGSERISNYALYWLVIFYLQKESIFPSVATLIAMNEKSRIIADWEVGVTHDFVYNENFTDYSFKELMIRFFTFYANFDFRYNVACPLLGEVMKKRDFAVHWKLPREMSPYIAYIDNNDDPEPLRIDSAMCIQDPFDLQHNITETVSKVFLCRFRNCCSKSLDVLCS